MKFLAIFVIVAGLAAISFSQRSAVLPRFGQYRSKVYTGKVTRPKWMKFENGTAVDEMGKPTEPASINFAGKYFISAHSCGTECRWYTLTDLSKGRDLNLLSGFDASEAIPRNDIPVLISRSNSNLLIVQYVPKLRTALKCRERAYLFQNGRLKPLGRVVGGCRYLK